MPTPEQLEAFILRTEEMAHQIGRLHSVGVTAAQDVPQEDQRLYLRLSYHSAKAALIAALRDALDGKPEVVPLTKPDGFTIQDSMSTINRALGYLQSLCTGLHDGPVQQEDGTLVVEWTQEQRDAIRAAVEAKVQEVRDALATLP